MNRRVHRYATALPHPGSVLAGPFNAAAPNKK
jgi:hypothetical protein